MRRFLERSLLSSRSGLFLLNLLTLISVGLAVYHTTNQLVGTIQQEIQAQQTVAALQQTLTLITDAETGRRGYGLTREERFLEPYYDAVSQLAPTLNKLQSYVAVDSKQQTDFKQLQSLIQQRLILLQEAIDSQQKMLDLNTQVRLSDRGRVIHDRIRKAIARMQEREQSRLQQLSAESQTWSRFTLLSLLAGMGLSLFLFTLTYNLLNRQIEAYQRSKTALAQNEEKLRLALEAARIGMWDWNLQTGEIIWSKEHAELFGLAPEDFDGNYETFDARLCPDDRSRVEQCVQYALDNRTTYQCEYRIIWPDQSIHWVEGRGQAFYDHTGRPYRMTGTIMDINERKHSEISQHQAETALRQSEERLRLAIEGAGMAWVEANLQTGTAIWSPNHFEMFGYEPAPDGQATFEMWFNRIHPADQQRVSQTIKQYRQQRSLCTTEYRCIRVDNGETFWLLMAGQFHHNETGIATRFIGILLDISDRKQAEIALQTLNAELEQRVASRTAELHQINENLVHEIQMRQEIEANLQQTIAEVSDLYNNAPCGYHSLDENGLFMQINNTELQWLGYTREEILYQKKFSDLLTPESAKAFQTNFPIFKQQGHINNLEYQIIRKDGSVFDVSINAIAIRDEQGNIIMKRATMIDISDRKRMEVEQQRIARMKDEFVSVVSHELRTPLTAVYGALNLLAENLVPTDSDQGQRVIQIATNNAERLVNLVNDILDLERLASGKISLHKELYNAATLLASAANLNQLLANRAGITLQVSANNVEIMVDRDRILQVLTNLLSNAIKFSPSGSTILLKAEVRDDESPPSHPPTLASPYPPTSYLLFSITDQGRGIPADKLESIFERFQQVDASDARKSGGTGLGLAISRSIVQQHGGQIWAESTVGEGSTFYFTIPL